MMKIAELNLRLIEAAKAGQTDQIAFLFEIAISEHLSPVNLNEPLSWAAHNGHNAAVNLLLDNGADIDYQDVQGNTPLHWAAYNAHTDTIKLLISRGANERMLNKNSLTPTKFASIQACINPYIHSIIELIENMAKEIAQLRARVTELESQLEITKSSRSDKTFPTSSNTGPVQTMRRFGMLKNTV